MRRFLLEISAHMYKEIKYIMRDPAWLVVFSIFPYVMAAMSCLMGIASSYISPDAFSEFQRNTGSSNAMLYFLTGYGIMFPSFLVVSVASENTGAEIASGTLEQIFVSPAKRELFILFSSFPYILFAMLGLIVSYAPLLLMGISILDFLIAMTMVFIGLLPLLGLGVLASNLTIKVKEYWSAANFLQAFLTLFSGFAYPISFLPEWMRLVSHVLPTSYAVELVRKYVEAHSISYSNLYGIVLMAIAYITAGVMSFRLVEKEGERSGSIYSS
ncbi:MAG: ABC transporter permease [Candidatus Methanodesulfokora sp.]|jgi:ABC-2 type transport system permease protein|nr:MAG: hypothetical protein C0200_06655 [Candidatus Korarchaeota archaeon]